VLRYTDLPELAAMFAPRRLTFYPRMPGEFEYSKHVWQLFGKPDAFETALRFHW
jgi:hypothetical protein